jgi:hypothetical protein
VLYKRARLRTPVENARRDWEAGSLWLQYIVDNLLSASLVDHQPQSVARLIVLLATPSPSIVLASQAVHVLNTCVDPFGWDEGQVAQTWNLERLDGMVENVALSVREIQEKRLEKAEKLCSIPVVIDSISPILIRHGFQRTVQYLKAIMNIPNVCPLVVTVQVELLSACQHRTLEDFAFAAICLHQGEASLLRRSVREKGNFVRRSLAYDIVQDEGSEVRKVRVLVESSSPQLHLDVIHDEEVAQTSGEAIATNVGAHGIAARRIKVQLKLEPDVPSKTKQTQSTSPGRTLAANGHSSPHIFLEDDDPEFDDYDEEDPDEDLEI